MGFSQAQVYQRTRADTCVWNLELSMLAWTLHESQVTFYCGAGGEVDIDGEGNRVITLLWPDNLIQ